MTKMIENGYPFCNVYVVRRFGGEILIVNPRPCPLSLTAGDGELKVATHSRSKPDGRISSVERVAPNVVEENSC